MVETKPITINNASVEQLMVCNSAKALQKELKLTDEQIQKGNLALLKVYSDAKLSGCDNISKLRFVYTVASLNYKNDSAIAAVPYGKSVQAQLQYQALLEDMDLTGHIVDRGVIELYKDTNYKAIINEDGYKVLENIPVVELKNIFDKPEVIGYYAYAKLDNGKTVGCIKSVEQIKAWASKYSVSYRGGKSSPWQSDFDKMAKKTVIKEVAKEVLKMFPVDRLSRALTLDQSVITDKGIEYLDNPKNANKEVLETSKTTVKNTIEVLDVEPNSSEEQAPQEGN